MKDNDTEDGSEEQPEEARGRGRPRNELPEIGDNLKPIIKEIKDSLKAVKDWAEKRDNINAQVQAIREKLHSLGIPKEAFDLSMRYLEWPEDKRRNFDIAYALCRDAMGQPIQRDLFDQV